MTKKSSRLESKTALATVKWQDITTEFPMGFPKKKYESQTARKLASEIERMTSSQRLQEKGHGAGYGLCLAKTEEEERQIIEIVRNFSTVQYFKIDDLLGFMPTLPIDGKLLTLQHALSAHRADHVIFIGGVHASSIFNKDSLQDVPSSRTTPPEVDDAFVELCDVFGRKIGSACDVALDKKGLHALAAAFCHTSAKSKWEWIMKNEEGPPVIITGPSFFHESMRRGGDRGEHYVGRDSFIWPDVESLFGKEVVSEVDIEKLMKELRRAIQSITG